MKYIVFSVTLKGNSTTELEVPIIFPNSLVHVSVAVANKSMLHRDFPDAEIALVSAGFINFIGSNVVCVGESESLKLKSRPEDTLLITGNDYGTGIK